jgi:hypothetical protein
MTPKERALATKIDRELLFLAPERSVGEYLIEKGYIEVEEDEDDDEDGEDGVQ